MDSIFVFAVMIVGSAHGSLSDPLIWWMILVTCIAARARAKWWMPAAIALVFNAVHIIKVMPWWTMMGMADQWPSLAAWLFVVKLFIVYSAFAAISLARRIWLRTRPTQVYKPSEHVL